MVNCNTIAEFSLDSSQLQFGDCHFLALLIECSPGALWVLFGCSLNALLSLEPYRYRRRRLCKCCPQGFELKLTEAYALSWNTPSCEAIDAPVSILFGMNGGHNSRKDLTALNHRRWWDNENFSLFLRRIDLHFKLFEICLSSDKFHSPKANLQIFGHIQWIHSNAFEKQTRFMIWAPCSLNFRLQTSRDRTMQTSQRCGSSS